MWGSPQSSLQSVLGLTPTGVRLRINTRWRLSTARKKILSGKVIAPFIPLEDYFLQTIYDYHIKYVLVSVFVCFHGG